MEASRATKPLSEKEFILTGNLWRVLFQLSWPAVLAMVIFGLNTVFDAFFVGRYVGQDGLAGISLTYPLTQFVAGAGSLIGVGAGSALSIAIGAHDQRIQQRLLGNTNALILLASLFLTVIGFVFATPLVQGMGGSGAALAEGVSYFRITMLGTVFSVAGLSGNMIIRAEGRMKTAAVMMGVGLLVNILGNYFAVVVFDFGVSGAAWATNLGMIVYTIVAYYYFARGHATFKTAAFGLYWDKEMLKSIISMGMSSFILTVMNTIQAAIILNTITSLAGAREIAVYGVTFRVFTFMLTPIMGLMRALQPVIGINYGAGQYERVITSFKRFALISTLLILPFWLLLIAFPQFVLNGMLPEMSFLANDFLNFRVYMLILPLVPVMFMAMTFYPAINQGSRASILGIIRQVVLYIPFMLLVPPLLGLNWVYYGSFLIDGVIVLACTWLITHTFRQLRQQIN